MLCTRIVALIPKAVNRCRATSQQPYHPFMLIRIARLRENIGGCAARHTDAGTYALADSRPELRNI
jgi:hypothetical protein